MSNKKRKPTPTPKHDLTFIELSALDRPAIRGFSVKRYVARYKRDKRDNPGKHLQPLAEKNNENV